MAKPYIHAKSSAKKFGGVMEDYIDIHDFMDSTKSSLADVRHRAILHSAFGCYIVEKVFGHTRKNSDGKEYSTRDVAEQHIIEDLGFIPSIDRWLQNTPIEEWMGGKSFKKKEVRDVLNHKETKEIEELKKQVEELKKVPPLFPYDPIPNPLWPYSPNLPYVPQPWTKPYTPFDEIIVKD